MFKAKSESVCSVCHKKIHVGDAYSWDRTGKTNDKWHEGCKAKSNTHKVKETNGHAVAVMHVPTNDSLAFIPIRLEPEDMKDLLANHEARISEISEIISMWMRQRRRALAAPAFSVSDS